MAKGARSHTIKRNRANLRSKVFGPESDARTERLAAKLQEVASQPKEVEQKESNTDSTNGQNGNTDAAPSHADEDMDIDGGSSKSTTKKSRGSSRIHKRHKGRKSSIVFRSKSTVPKLGGKRK